ncbi:PIN domain-containing protein [Methanothrix sp.]|uniref:type II toxin-antitoxin system VapC family toxin n=1 Tax=Methanothrix sp. TaxID=90426 RepID=UPI0025EEB4A7|nr:PIN domain-containing protein [Methanothrix sp.]
MQQIDADSIRVIIDTNALMAAEQFGVDIFGELMRLGYVEWIVPAQVRGELLSIAERAKKGRDRTAARVALGLAGQCKVVGIDNCPADQAIVDLAEKEGAAVFTNDKALKKRLFSKGITVIYLRQGRYLEAMKKEY